MMEQQGHAEDSTFNNLIGVDPKQCEDKSTDHSSDYDTLGLHLADVPRNGGVRPEAERSIEGGISAITTPEHFVPVVQIKIPLPPLNEISTNTNIVDRGDGGTTTISTAYEERVKVARNNLEAGLRVRDLISYCTTVR